jgi:lantibiotic transport system permease protein
MLTSFIHSFQSEWLKTRRSSAAWLIIIGSIFIPLIILIANIVNFDDLYGDYNSGKFWERTLQNAWQFMAVFLLPMGVIIATSLITQLEFKNNTWKQVHTTPQHFTNVFLSKLLVITVLMVSFFLLFNIAIIIVGNIPSIIFRGIPFPKEDFPFLLFVKTSIKYFIACLPILALQYLLSLQFKNVLIPISSGLALYVVSMIAINWKHGNTVPYTYSAYVFIGKSNLANPDTNIYYWAIAYFLVFTLASYFLYLAKKEKG